MIDIHQIFVSGESNIPEKYKEDIQSVKKVVEKYSDRLNYNFWDYDKIKYNFYDDPVLEDFDWLLANNKSNKSYVMIGDYFRWAICLKFGGLYFDTDIRIDHGTDIWYIAQHNIFMPFEMKPNGDQIAVAHMLYIDKNYISEFHKNRILQIFRDRLHQFGIDKNNKDIKKTTEEIYKDDKCLVNLISVHFLDQVIKEYILQNQYQIRIENPIHIFHNFRFSWHG